MSCTDLRGERVGGEVQESRRCMGMAKRVGVSIATIRCCDQSAGAYHSFVRNFISHSLPITSIPHRPTVQGSSVFKYRKLPGIFKKDRRFLGLVLQMR